MEELHRIHKDVPFGYWVDGVVPLYRWLLCKWTERKTDERLPAGLNQPSAPH